MQELIAQLLRLYLPAGTAPDELARHLDGGATRQFSLAQADGIRAVALPFDAYRATQWEQLCAVANALQDELGLPAPAVSVSGGTGFCLWLPFEQPVPAALARQFVDALCSAYCPEAVLPAESVLAPVALPPCRNPATGKWAAFIHPGMGASFADEPALEMPPPHAGQAALLEGLQPVGAAQLRHALEVLAPPQPAGPVPAAATASRADGVPPGLLLKDATLEDIVRFLHAQNIEPTFRHLLPPR